MLAAWCGLGYYHRARNLHRGAQHVARAPRRARSRARSSRARACPASALYTAGAVLSIAYGDAAAGRRRQRAARARAPARAARPARAKDGPLRRAPRSCSTRAPGRLEPGADGARRDRLPAAQARLPRLPAAPALPRPFARDRGRAPEKGARAGTPSRDRGRGARRARRAASCWCAAPRGRLMDRMWEVPQTSLDPRGRPDLARGDSKSATACASSPGRSRSVRATPSPTAASRSRATAAAAAAHARGPRALPLGAARTRWRRLAVASSTRKLLRGCCPAAAAAALVFQAAATRTGTGSVLATGSLDGS